MDLINQLKNNYYNIRGFRTDRKIIVIESDDWGGIRTRSKKDYELLNSRKIISESAFNRYDSLEDNSDYESLFDMLSSVKDKNGESLKITTNFIVTNPDFDKIRKDKYEKYHFETFTSSYDRYNKQNNTLDLIKEGIDNNLIYPQFHGREHVQVEYWIRDLNKEFPKLLEGFNHNFFSFSINEVSHYSYLSAFMCLSPNDLNPVKLRITEGLDIFKKIFNYNSISLIAPENHIHNELLKHSASLGIKTIQGARVGLAGLHFDQDREKRRRFLGFKNNYKQLDLVRNVVFEPSASSIDWISKSFKEIENAFFWKKPAVICSHRFNYIGKLELNNREKGLLQLKQLISHAQYKWPEIEFMTTEELYNLIVEETINKK